MQTLLRPHIALFLALALAIGLTAFGPIAQLSNYHHFADQRSLFGVANAGDVLSNLGFLLVAGYGMLALHRARGSDGTRLQHAVFLAALGATAIGSTWYHLAPDDARLVWDRLPIALACAALLAGAIQQAYPRAATGAPTLLGLTALGVLSVLWWSWTGDLRFYLLIQAAPLVLIPALQWQAGAPLRQRTLFFVAIGLYVLAKMFELADHAVFEALGAISGHTIKHALAVGAALVLVKAHHR